MSPRAACRAYASGIDARTSPTIVHVQAQIAERAIQIPDLLDDTLPLVAAVVLFALLVAIAVRVLRRVIIRRNPDLVERQERLPAADAG